MTPKHLFISSLLALPLIALPLAASAQEARTAKWVNLRAGPDRDYPLVASFGPNTPLAVQGCTDGYGWCDVIGPNGARGWMYAGNISYSYQNSYVPLLSYGPQIGLPIIGFTIGAYWGSYYRNRPFYNTIPRWEHHRPPPRPIVRPPIRPGPPPRPGFGRPDGNRPPPSVRPPGGNRPPPGVRPPGGGRPGGGRPGEGVGGGGRPGGGGGGGGGGGRPGGGGERPGGGGNRPGGNQVVPQPIINK
jgi:uncharacterized protein YraI